MGTPAPVVVRVEGVSKRFVIRKDKSLKERLVNFRRSTQHKEDFWALRDVSLDIEAGSTVGLIGPNGSGKSTLLKVIGGIIQPTVGNVFRRGRLAALLELGAGFHPDLTGRENVFLNAAILGLSRSQTERHFDDIVEFSGIERFIDTQVKFYSSGMYVRLAFAVAVHVDPDLLLVDEVLAVGDEPFQRKCMDRIRGFQEEGRTIVLVTHALDQVAELCDRAIVLEAGRVVEDGEPRNALRTLREDYEAARVEAEERTGTETRSTRLHVVSVDALGPDGQPLHRLSAGDDLLVRIRVASAEPVRDWMLGVGLETPLGQIVYGTNTQLLGTPLPPLHGHSVVDVRLEDVALGEGQYFISAAVADRQGVELDRKSQGASVYMTSDGTSIGIVKLAADVRVS